MKNMITLGLLATLALLFFIKSEKAGSAGAAHQATPVIEAVRPASYHLPVVNHNQVDTPPVKTIPLELGQEPFLQYPQIVSHDDSLFLLSCGGSTRGEFLWLDQSGRLRRSYGRIGHGPGELSEPFALNIVGDEVFITEARKQAVHILSLNMTYREKISFRGLGEPQFVLDDLLGVWGYRRYSRKNEAGHMLTLYDRTTGESVQDLVPVHQALFSLSMVGGAVLHREKIYAITANTGFIDIVDTNNLATTRLDPHDGIYVFQPEPWQKWSARHPKGTRTQRVRAWQATFPIPVDIGVIQERLIILYARGERYFYNVHDLKGELISRNHDVPIPHPHINGSRLEGVAVDENDVQYYAYINLAFEKT